MMVKKQVQIFEVGPRDGFQNVSEFIPTDTKLTIIDGLISSGIKNIQCSSFMNPKAVPQLSDAKQVVTTCVEKYKDTDVLIYALAANRKGVEIGAECGIKHLSFVTSASESHNMSNVKKTVDSSVAELKDIIKNYPDISFTWDVAMAFGCAFEGPLSNDHILKHIDKGIEIGLKSFNLCDSNGIATPDLIENRLRLILDRFQDADFRVHIHDTRNMGMLNSLTALNCGIEKVEVSVCGLGGCPFFPGASGNTSTEDFVYMLNGMGYKTGIDFEKLLEIAKFSAKKIDGNFSGHHIRITGDRCYQ